MFSILVLSCLLSCGLSAPANDQLLDKATVNDVAVNSVSPDRKTDADVEITTEKKDGANVQITGITTGFNGETGHEQPFKPQRASSMFARFIDDIFQIPINVLQNVAKLITSPFVSKKTEHQDPVTITATS